MPLLHKRPTRPPSGSTLSISATPSVNLTVGLFYSQANPGVGGVTPRSFAIVLGLPPTGTSIDPTTGTVSGTLLSNGTFSYTVQVTDAQGTKKTVATTAVIAPSPISVDSNPPSIAQVGAAFLQLNTGHGGVTPYVYSIGAGSVPLGTGPINPSTGTVSGTPTTAGPFSYTVRVTDNIGSTADAVPTTGTVLAAGSTITALSPNGAHVQAAIDAAAVGNTVLVPAGVGIWPTALTNSKAIRLVGAGLEDDGTVIWSDTGSHQLLNFAPTTSGFCEITGFQFNSNDPVAPAQPPNGAHIGVTGPVGAKNCRIHHNSFNGLVRFAIDAQTKICGLVDHNRFTGYAGCVTCSGQGLSEWTGTGIGARNHGTSDWFFIEDNEFSVLQYRPLNDQQNGGHLVVRYNYGLDTFFQTHDKERVGLFLEGGAYYEVYGNTFATGPAGNWKGLDIASGTGVVFNNKFTGPWNHAIGLIESRSDTLSGNITDGLIPLCGGSSSWDSNLAGGQGYVCWQQVGSTGLQGVPVSDPVRSWGNTLNGAPYGPTSADVTATDGGFLTQLHIQIGRDYINLGSAWGSYPGQYTYPHPLQASGTSWGTTYYVDSVNGNNANSGLKPDAALASVQGMGGNVGGPTPQPGDKVYFHKDGTWTPPAGQQGLYLLGGVTYIGNKWPAHGASKSQATIVAGGNFTAGVVFFRDHATQPTKLMGFDINANFKAASGISLNYNDGATPGPLTGAMKVVRGNTVRNIGGSFTDSPTPHYTYGIMVSNHAGAGGEVANVTIENNIVHDIARDGLCLYPGDESAANIIRNLTVRGNEVYNCGLDPNYARGSGIVVKGRVIDANIEFNYVHGPFKGAGFFVNSNENNHYGFGPLNVHIRYNIANVVTTEGSFRIYDLAGGDPKDIRLYGNIAHSNTAGPGLLIGDFLSGANSLRIYNNTFVNAGILIEGTSAATFPVLEFTNNIVYMASGIPLTEQGQITAHANNLYYGTGTLISRNGVLFNAGNLTTYEGSAITSTASNLFSNVASLPQGFTGIYGLASVPNTVPGLVPKQPESLGLTLILAAAKHSGQTLASPYDGSINSVARAAGAFDRGAFQA